MWSFDGCGFSGCGYMVGVVCGFGARACGIGARQ